MPKKNKKRQSIEREKQRRNRILLCIVFFISIYIVLSMTGDMGFTKYLKMRDTKKILSEEIVQLKIKNDELEKESISLKTDDEYIEAIARERLGLVREGEKVYLFK